MLWKTVPPGLSGVGWAAIMQIRRSGRHL